MPGQPLLVAISGNLLLNQVDLVGDARLHHHAGTFGATYELPAGRAFDKRCAGFIGYCQACESAHVTREPTGTPVIEEPENR